MQTIKDIFEMIYFISGPLIAFFAFKALGQIKEARQQVFETKENRIISSKRESYKIAADKCEYFLNTITPLIDNLDKEVKDRNINFFKRARVTVNENNINVQIDSFDKAELDKVMVEIPTLELFNPLDGFSLFFTSGVAEENIGYLTVGQSYCDTVERYLPLIAIFSKNKHFTNIIELYKIWNSRLQCERLEMDKMRIDKELKDKKGLSIKTIGTE
jgi:hypothetical protein